MSRLYLLLWAKYLRRYFLITFLSFPAFFIMLFLPLAVNFKQWTLSAESNLIDICLIWMCHPQQFSSAEMDKCLQEDVISYL